MKKIICLLICMVLIFVSCNSTENVKRQELPKKQVQTEQESEQQDESIPSVYMMINGEKTLIVDMNNPLSKNFYTGCEDLDIDQFGEIELEYWEKTTDIENPEIETASKQVSEYGYLDSRYTFPIQFVDMNEYIHSDTSFAEDMINGQPITGYYDKPENSDEYGGIVFDKDGYAIGVAEFNQKEILRTRSLMSGWYYIESQLVYRKDLGQKANIQYMVNQCGAFSDIDENGITKELKELSFDLLNTSVQRIESSYADFIFQCKKEFVFSHSDDNGMVHPFFEKEKIFTPKDLGEYALNREFTFQANKTRHLDNLVTQDRAIIVENIKLVNGDKGYKTIDDTRLIYNIISIIKTHGKVEDDRNKFEYLENIPDFTIIINDNIYHQFYKTELSENSYFWYYVEEGYLKEQLIIDGNWIDKLLLEYNNDFKSIEESYDINPDWLTFSGTINPPTGKPVIYLYPETEIDVNVTLQFDGNLTYTYPTYNDKWNVTASPDGSIINKSDGSLHYYLFWEGITSHKWSMETGFVVKQQDLESFLIDKLSYMGLTAKEYNDFIVYWLPQMMDKPYYLIHFSDITEYDQVAKLEVYPKPDNILRVHMAWSELDEYAQVKEQQLPQLDRSGFTVIEWGGTQVY